MYSFLEVSVIVLFLPRFSIGKSVKKNYVRAMITLFRFLPCGMGSPGGIDPLTLFRDGSDGIARK